MVYERDFPIPRVVDKESLGELAQIYKKFSQTKRFPFFSCTLVSMEVSGLGFEYAEGNFQLDSSIEQFGNNVRVGHSWCEDGEGKIIDLTLSQFNEGLEVPVKKGIIILKPDNPLYLRYNKSRYPLLG